MSEQSIVSVLIDKLNHNIPEIRTRSLNSLISKLKRGYLIGENVPQAVKLLEKLFKWLDEGFGEEDKVFDLIDYLLQGDPHYVVVRYFGIESILSRLMGVKRKIDASLSEKVEAIISHVLSCAKDDEETCSTPDISIKEYSSKDIKSSKPKETFIWQSLLEQDLKVLNSVQNSIKTDSDQRDVIETCGFLSNVLFKDFPAEVFLQRPAIMKSFFVLLQERRDSHEVLLAVFSCLHEFMSELIVRVNFHQDPNIRCSLVDFEEEGIETPNALNGLKANSELRADFQLNQTSTYPSVMDFAITVFQNAISLLEDKNRKSKSLKICVAKTMLKCALLMSKSIPADFWITFSETRQKFTQTLASFAQLMDTFRVSVMATGFDRGERFIHLSLLITAALLLKRVLPKNKLDSILPKKLKEVLSNAILDSTFAKFYPAYHEAILDCVKEISDRNNCSFLTMYKDAKTVGASMSAAAKLIKNHTAMHCPEFIKLMKDSLPSLEFHRNLKIVDIFVVMCAERAAEYSKSSSLVSTTEEVTLHLLAHQDADIKAEMYKQCHRWVMSYLGALDSSCAKGVLNNDLDFLLRPNVLMEIISHGAISDNPQIKNYSVDILSTLLKSRFIVQEKTWETILNSFLPVVPMLQCHANASTAFGKCILKMFDPDLAPSLQLLPLEVFKGNLRFLFNSDDSVRDEAISRLCWALATDDESRSKLPKISSLESVGLGRVCLLGKPITVCGPKPAQFYEENAIRGVLDLLAAERVEPSVKRSALSQLSVMMDCPDSIPIFIEKGGLETILDIMKDCLIVDTFRNYPDSMVPALSVLRNVCLYDALTRQELAFDFEVLSTVLRGLLVFCTDERVKQDASQILFLLLFNEFIAKESGREIFAISVPNLLGEQLKLPIVCRSHWKTSQHADPCLKISLYADKWCRSLLRVCWNTEWFENTDQILNWARCKDSSSLHDFDSQLILSDQDLNALKSTSAKLCCFQLIYDVQNSTSHKTLKESIGNLEGYLRVQNICSSESLWDLPWEQTFKKFLLVPPGTEEDVLVLTKILETLQMLLSNCFNIEKVDWLISLIKSPGSFLLRFIKEHENKELTKHVLSIIKECTKAESRIARSSAAKTDPSKWKTVVECILSGLRRCIDENCRDIATIDQLLDCLVNVSTCSGWSKSSASNTLMEELLDTLVELFAVFHCGKAAAASCSFLGINVVRNILLTLNHLLCETQQRGNKSAGILWQDYFTETSALNGLLSLWTSRDSILRASSFQLLSGLCASSKSNNRILDGLREARPDLVQKLIAVVVDAKEAGIIREQAASFLSGLTKSSLRDQIAKPLLEHLKVSGFYNRLKNVLNNFHAKARCILSLQSTEILDGETSDNITPPCVVKAIAWLLCDFMSLNANGVGESLHDKGLPVYFLRCLYVPDQRSLLQTNFVLFFDFVEMCSAICCCVRKLISGNEKILLSIAGAEGNLHALLSVLNHSLYDTNNLKLRCLRNQLWSEAFALLAMLTCRDDFPCDAVVSAMRLHGNKEFMRTLYEAIKVTDSEDLRHSALICLTNLLQSEMSRDPSNCPLKQALANRPPVGAVPDSPALDSLSEELCYILMTEFQCCSNSSTTGEASRSSQLVMGALTALLGLSNEAKLFALRRHLVSFLLAHLRQTYVRLTLSSADAYRSVVKKKGSRLVHDVHAAVNLLANFMRGEAAVKRECAQRSLADLLQRLWPWLAMQKQSLLDCLRLVCTYTSSCEIACQSTAIVSNSAGDGPKISPSSKTLLSCILSVFNREMELITKSHSLEALELCTSILCNCCCSVECRVILSRSEIFLNLSMLYAASMKKQKPWDYVEFLWLQLLEAFTSYGEGQQCIAKSNDSLEVIYNLALSQSHRNRTGALLVLRNLSLHKSNRYKLLSTTKLFDVLDHKLVNGTNDEVFTTFITIWSLVANNQKAKLLFRSAGFVPKLKKCILVLKTTETDTACDDHLSTMEYILSILSSNQSNGLLD